MSTYHLSAADWFHCSYKCLRLIIFNYIQKQTTGTCTIQTVWWLDQIFKAISQDKYKLDTCIIFEKENCTLNFIFYAKNSVTYVTLIIKSLHKWMSLFFFLLSTCIVLSIQIWCHYLDLEPGIPRTVSYITGWSHIHSSPYTGTVYGCYHWFGTLPKK